MRFARLLLAGLVAVSSCAGCRTAPEDELRGFRERAVSRETFERVLPFLADLRPGDALTLFEEARRVHGLGSEQKDAPSAPVVVMPAWIASLSGGAPGGISMLGQLVGRTGDALYGSHVFGWVESGRVVPRYQLLTRATLVPREELETLAAEHVRGIGVLPRPDGLLHFRDLHVAGTRPLPFPAPDEDAPIPLPNEGVAGLGSEASYRAVLPVLDGLEPGTDLLSMLAALGAVFVSEDWGESHSLLVPGFLQHPSARTRTVERPDAILKLRPFGWIEDERVVVERIAIFENDRLRRVVPHSGPGSFADRLESLLGEPEPAPDSAR